MGQAYADQIEQLSLELYETANTYAAERGIIIADTKFEFGLDESTTPATVVLVDEVLTPDSSRFWSVAKYEVGRGQDSYDKQYLRGRGIPPRNPRRWLTACIDWLVASGLKGQEGVEMPDDVGLKSIERYKEAYRSMVGKGWDAREEAAA